MDIVSKISILLILFEFLQSSYGYTVTYLTTDSPPSPIPSACGDLKYGLPINRQGSYPIKAHLKDSGGTLVTPTDAAAYALFDIESIEAAQVANPAYVDPWIAGGGRLCQWGAQGLFPRRMQRKYFTVRCSEGNKLTGFTTDRGLLTVDGLMHQHNDSTVPTGNRIYRITVHLPDGTTTATADTNPFTITDQAAELVITAEPPPSVEAQEAFSVSVVVNDAAGNPLTAGMDSCLFAEIQISWEEPNQVFESEEKRTEMLFRESIRMRGGAVMKKAMYNYVIRETMVNGAATFSDIKILDVTAGVKLNVTSFMQSFPFSRRPDDYDDLAAMMDTTEDGIFIFYQNLTAGVPLSKGVVLTTEVIVTAQIATQLVILDPLTLKPKQGANFPLSGKVIIEVQDANGVRIFSGDDAALDITVTVNPSSACLSADAAFSTVEGRGEFLGSICDTQATVSVIFDAVSVISTLPLATATTGTFEVVSEIHLGHFIDLRYSGSGNDAGPHIDSFVHFCKEDVNSGHLGILPGRQVIVHTYDTKNNDAVTITKYKSMMREGEADPSQMVRGVIGFGINRLSQKIQPLLTNDQMPQLATREDLYDFGDKVVYPYYNRISWEMGASAHSVLMAAKSRGWTKIVVMRHIDFEVSKVFYSKAKFFGIELSEVTIPSMAMADFGVMGLLSDEMNRVKAAKTKIVWVFCYAPQFWKLIREAIMAEVAPINGYQWVTMGLVSWHQPFGNQLGLCNAMSPICTVGLRGLHGFAATYKIDGLRSAIWEPILTRHIKKDRLLYPGTIPKHTLTIATAEFALGYDAMLVYAHALNNIITASKTVTGPALALAVRDVDVDGLTGNIVFTEKGNRPGYRGFISVTDPHPPTLGTPVSGTAIMSRFFELESETALTQLEIRGAIQWPLNTYSGPPYDDPLNPYALPPTTYLNKRRYNGTDGMLDGYEEIVAIPPSTTAPSLYVEMVEDAVAPFYCVLGCGGERFNDFDITQYRQGDCITMDECLCHDGFYGDQCESMICVCKNGRCEIPRVCICDAGWEGDTCQFAICTNPCSDNGKCTSPDVCTCDSGYVGSTCGDQLAVIVTIPVILVIALIVGGFFFARWFLKRQALKSSLANLDWKVNWDEEIQTGVGAISMVSTAAEELTSKKNFVTWKSIRCYSQLYDCDTLDVNNIHLRLEIVQLKELRHNNLLHFIGASLEWPHVCLLVEPCPKGSLEDLLANDNVKLGWDFKYSLLKDICRGMDYLHRSDIRSHGRLKSTNCLVDNRWTCKIAGFGAPTFRFQGQRKAIPGAEEENSTPERQLFWTAPELLGGVTCIKDVGKGTPAGDVYAFAIILSEIISREEPYSSEMMNLDAEEILLLVRDKNSATAAKAKRAWYEGGGDTTKNFRPKIDDNNLPEEYAAKNGLRKLVEVNWHESPENRLSFRQNLDKLNEIYPIKGELIDNLVNMLEKYSNNLEAIVNERTKELMVEKAKTEQLISQMLPKKVVEDLKHGRVVEPESFEKVTIFFSDLVGFTAIAKESTPLQVVDLLNDLYTTFDSILDTYDVYKVETIGDAYMVVSGLPIRNGDLHAGEIATMSLELLSSMCDFKIRHMPGTTLQLRIGMHSGPAVAGVVGLKMPRYCLFGDTVNTASRMESSSIALRIHMSEMTANVLFKLGGYHLDCRGEREVKGKGMMTTYWLEGKDGFTKPLPGKDLAVSASKHEFK